MTNRLDKLNILVTGVGAIIGYGIINSLRMTGRDLNIIGIDIYEDAVGQFFCDQFIQGKRADAPDYPAFLLEIIKKHHIHLVFFGTEQELYRVSDERELFTQYLDRLVLNNQQIIDLSKDKRATHLFLSNHNIDVIPTIESGTFEEISQQLGLPFILKLRSSYASKGVFTIHDKRDYDYWTSKVTGKYIFQQIVGDDEHEYTAAVFGHANGTTEPFILRRKLSKDGATVKAVVEYIPSLYETIRQLTDLLPPVGPTNYQFRLHNGKYLLLEFNPRVSSSTSIRAAFGYNEAEMCIAHYVEKNTLTTPITTSGQAIRYISDWIRHENRTHF